MEQQQAAEAMQGFASVAEAVESHRQTSYEYLGDEAPFVPDKERRMLQHLDNRRIRMRQDYADVDADEDLMPEAKDRKKDEIHKRDKPHIESQSQRVIDGLLSQARVLERKAKPWPERQSKDLSNDTERLSLAYAEADRLVRVANKRSTLGNTDKRNPLYNLGDFLKEKYAEGMSTGGAQGSALCAGVLRAAEELGASQEEILNSLRTDEQRQMVDEARRLQMFAGSISTDTPQPRRRKRTGPRRLRGGQAPKLLSGGGNEPMAIRCSNRKRAWK
jgi:hypothetical protein